MLIKHAFLAISLSMGISSVAAASETTTAPSTNQSSTTTTQTSQPSQNNESSQSTGENKSPAKMQSGADKKPSMADFCRKNPC